MDLITVLNKVVCELHHILTLGLHCLEGLLCQPVIGLVGLTIEATLFMMTCIVFPVHEDCLTIHCDRNLVDRSSLGSHQLLGFFAKVHNLSIKDSSIFLKGQFLRTLTRTREVTKACDLIPMEGHPTSLIIHGLDPQTCLTVTFLF